MFQARLLCDTADVRLLSSFPFFGVQRFVFVVHWTTQHCSSDFIGWTIDWQLHDRHIRRSAVSWSHATVLFHHAFIVVSSLKYNEAHSAMPCFFECTFWWLPHIHIKTLGPTTPSLSPAPPALQWYGFRTIGERMTSIPPGPWIINRNALEEHVDL